MSTPTPGPWVVKRDTGLRQRIQSASGGTLANLTSRPLPYGANFSHEQIVANARLIAAAPELLAALLPMIEGTQWLTSEHVDAARKAIAKAKGEA